MSIVVDRRFALLTLASGLGLVILACSLFLLMRLPRTTASEGHDASAHRPHASFLAKAGAASSVNELPAVPDVPERSAVAGADFDAVDIYGRVVDAHTQAPIGGLRVQVEARPLVGNRRLPSRLVWGSALAEVTTGTDGTFVLRVARNVDHRLLLSLTYAAATILAPIDPIVRAKTYDLGVISLGGCSVLSGRVIDKNQNVAPTATLEVLRVAAPTFVREEVAQPGRVAITVDASGVFKTTEALTEGTWLIAGRNCSVVDAPAIRVDSAGMVPTEPIDVIVNLWRGSGVAGTVVDARGKGIAGIRLVGRLQDGIGSSVTRKDGSFTLACGGARGEIQCLQMIDDTETYASRVEMGAWPQGTSGLRFELTEASTLELQVVDARTGRGIPSYDVRLIGEDDITPVLNSGGPFQAPGARSARCNSVDGILVVKGLAAGRKRVIVRPNVPNYAPTGLLVVPEGAATYRVRLNPADVVVSVRSEQGAPIPAALVRVEHLVAGAPAATGAIVVSMEAVTSAMLGSRMPFAVEVARVRTNSTGEVVLGVPSEGHFRLTVDADGYCGLSMEQWNPVRLPAKETVTLRRGGTVHGRIKHWADEEIDGHASNGRGVWLENVDNHGQVLPMSRELGTPSRYRVENSGEFMVDVVPAGQWRVWADLPPVPPETVGQRGLLATCHVEIGQTTTVEADMGTLAAGHLVGVVTRLGKPYWGRVWATAVQESNGVRECLNRSGPWETNRAGNLDIQLRPGTYTLTLQETLSLTHEPQGSEDACVFEIMAGQTTSRELRVDPRVIVVEVIGVEQPLTGARFCIVPTCRSTDERVGVEENGGLVFENAPGDPFLVRCDRFPGRADYESRTWGPFRPECGVARQVIRIGGK